MALFNGFPTQGGGFNPYMSPGMMPQGSPYGQFPQGVYPQAQSPAPAAADTGASLMAFLTAFIGPVMQGIMAPAASVPNVVPQQRTTPTTEVPNGETPDPSSEEPEITDDPKTNSGALSILNEYCDQIPTKKSGRMTKKDLDKFIKSPPEDAPEELVEAAKTLSNNDNLYNLLVLKSKGTAQTGFKVKDLDTDWEKQGIKDIDSLEDEIESVDNDEDAVKAVQKNYAAFDAISSGDGITIDDLKQVALGKVTDKKLKDPAIRGAALRVLNNQQLQDDLDHPDGDTKEADGIILKTSIDYWINQNKSS